MWDETMVRAVAARQDMLITAAQAVQLGMRRSDIATRCRRGEWHAISRGVYLTDADLRADDIPLGCLLRAAVLTHGPQFCLVATSAVLPIGLVGLPARPKTIEVAAIGGTSRHPRAATPTSLGDTGVAVVVRQLPVAAAEIEYIDGLAVRRTALSVVDAALMVDRPTALALLDSALHLQRVTPAELADSVARSEHRRGIVTVRELVALADGRAESQVESRVRLACIDGGVPPDDLQYPVRDDNGHLVAVGDLGWRRRSGRPLLAEADGESVHGLPQAVYRDRARGNALVAQSCDTVRFTYADTFKRGYIPAVITSALRAS